MWTIARRDLLDHLQSARFMALCALAVVLLPISAWVNAISYESRRAQADALAAESGSRLAHVLAERDRLHGIGDAWTPQIGWNATSAPDPALRAFRTPLPASVLALGADAWLPAYWQFGSEGVIEGPALGGTSDAASGAGAMDAIYIVQVVLGLLAILLGFDAISGDNERGMLRALLAHPIPRARLLAGRFLGALLTLLVPLLLGAPLALATLGARGFPTGRPDVWPRLAMIFALATLYLACMLALALAVSAWTRQARTSLILLLIAWVTLVLIVPRGATLAAAALHPAPSEETARRTTAAAVAALQQERVRRLGTLWRSSYGSDELPGASLTRATRHAYNDARAPAERELAQRKRAVMRTVADGRARALEAQRTLAVRLALASPAALFAAAAESAAGTDPSLDRRWTEQVRVHDERLAEALFDRVFGVEIFSIAYDGTRVSHGPDFGDPTDRPPAYDEIPTFVYEPPPMRTALAGAVPGACGLLLLTLAGIGAATVGLERCEVQ